MHNKAKQRARFRLLATVMLLGMPTAFAGADDDYKWEAVLRYTDFNSPHKDQDQEQWALGLNYLFASNVIAKLAYEFNHGLNGEPTDDNRLLLQLAYGF